MSKKIVEYRGCKGLVFAEITKDNNETGTGEGYVTGAVKDLAGVAEISKNVSVSRVSKYYDNYAAIVVTGEGEDVVTFTASIPSMDVQAAVNGRVYDSTLKMYIECPIVNKYYAVGYIIEDTDGTEYYIWRHKGYFIQPDETSATKDDGTDGMRTAAERASKSLLNLLKWQTTVRSIYLHFLQPLRHPTQRLLHRRNNKTSTKGVLKLCL